MKRVFVVVLLILCLFNKTSFSQNLASYKWYNPIKADFPVIEGQAWSKETAGSYNRFPARAEKSLNPNVWNISHSSAGLYIKFKTDAQNLVIRYKVNGDFAMSHMPATGVSGLDLYVLDPNGQWCLAPGSFSFKDTITYRFSNIKVSADFAGRSYEYRLFLPLYNSLSWLEIGVPSGSAFNFMPLSKEKPVLVYGTSIVQGACASRPGLAWTSILQRALDRPLINLGFSGSGLLEKSVIDLMAEVDAKIYVLDCMPNMISFSDQEIEARLSAAIQTLKQKHPLVPILLVEHSGGNAGGLLDTGRNAGYGHVNKVLDLAYSKLIAAGTKGIYLLTGKEIGFGINSTVDGLHPNDIGMEQYAAAYEKTIHVIINEPVGRYSTTRPAVQSRDGYYDWRSRHNEILTLIKTSSPRIVFLGNSILNYWGGEPKAPLARGADSWDKYMEPVGVKNFGFGWDQVENVLWRVYHEEIDGFKADKVMIMIGTNNLSACSDQEISEGLKMLVLAVKERQPTAEVILSGLLPRRAMESRIKVLNKAIAKLAAQTQVRFIDPGKILLNHKGKIDESLFGDGLHPNGVGYQKLAVTLVPYLKK
ncbi:acetylhydrolase [Mucilaginibacter rubeus]|uniref:Acetylhydrolase n=1 Tax=Mucilaginibacter rubeus TaxID=2027860 RepID=A0AAE6JC15_9SPHI|nr:MULTISPECIES: SGNH/GDSL hydrolase family protein [Mucilaginibacter]QEM02726.1 acetylhydrolase [Mucilaginibacter rubeus]QEM15345.1 acetylhydrolase [Mucilaginibacter gossypii]QTE41926.1 SGNH/GDSL hydrolase family protein [Mucilaginibacter rubeus]QTE48529.1 SGNH/GDSL hydrolase family protein [Mucilaginibacter rubeus]QTE59915.1 SGNH/GDSL hydrolase family protein [Mucilaginibacter rubeus]